MQIPIFISHHLNNNLNKILNWHANCINTDIKGLIFRINIMMTTLIFCICAIVLCCYTIHILLQDRRYTENEIYKAMQEIDQIALRSTLKTPKSENNTKKTLHLTPMEMVHEADTLGKSLGLVTEVLLTKDNNIKIKPSIINTYPIAPQPKLSTGYGFDVRI